MPIYFSAVLDKEWDSTGAFNGSDVHEGGRTADGLNHKFSIYTGNGRGYPVH